MTAVNPISALREQRLYALCPDHGAQLLEIHPALGSASGAISLMAPGVYEGLRTFERSKFFGLRAHLDRLKDSVDGFRVPLSYDEDALVAGLDVAARDATAAFDAETRVRVDVCAAPATTLGTESNVLFAMTPYRGLPEDVAKNGAYLRTAPGLARPFPGVKTSDFIPLREAWITAHGDADAYEHLMLNSEGQMLEGTQGSVCFVKGGAVYSAPSGVLPGVTLRTVLTLARENGVEVREEFSPLSDLDTFDEAFMTTSVRNVVPVSRVDEKRFASPGPVTAQLAKLYDDLSSADAVVAKDNRSARF